MQIFLLLFIWALKSPFKDAWESKSRRNLWSWELARGRAGWEGEFLLYIPYEYKEVQGAQVVKNPANEGDSGLIPGPGRAPGNLLQCFLPGEFHEQRSLAGCSPWGQKELGTTERLTLLHASFLVFIVVHTSVILTTIQALLSALSIHQLIPHGDLWMQSPFSRWGNWGLERFDILPQIWQICASHQVLSFAAPGSHYWHSAARPFGIIISSHHWVHLCTSWFSHLWPAEAKLIHPVYLCHTVSER